MRFASGINSGVGNSLPSSPIGNLINNNQPMGGYNYYNPWDVQRRQEEQIQREYNESSQKLDFLKAYLTSGGYDEREADAILASMKPKYKNLAEYNDKQRELREEQMFQQSMNTVGPTQVERVATYLNEKKEEYDKRYSNKSKKEQYEEMTNIGLELLAYNSKMSRRNLTGQYDRTNYRNLISSMNNSTGYISGNADDLEVELPSAVTDVYVSRRTRFLEAIGR